MQVQDIVVGNKNFTDVTKPSEIVQLLLNEDQLANLDGAAASSSASSKGKKADKGDSGDSAVRDLWNEEGDEFFGHSAPAQTRVSSEQGEEEESRVPTPVKTGRGRGRKREPGTSTRGSKPRGRGGRGGRRKAQAPPADAE